MNRISVLLFATLKERAGKARLDVEIHDGATVADLKQAVKQAEPALGAALDTSIVSINQEFAFNEDTVPAGAEAAFFPPVSGGSDQPELFLITEDPLNVDELIQRITLPATGAACVFTGLVRGETQRGEPHQTTVLEYEAYKPMAEAKMAQVAGEIRSRWPAVQGIVIVQRIGRLGPGTPTTLIACTAAHRDTGVFEAARYGIDRLKEIVPVWKKEIGPDGAAWVEGPYRPSRED